MGVADEVVYVKAEHLTAGAAGYRDEDLRGHAYNGLIGLEPGALAPGWAGKAAGTAQAKRRTIDS